MSNDTQMVTDSGADAAAKYHAGIAVAALTSSTVAVVTNHLSSDAYTAILSMVLGYAFGNFKQLTALTRKG